MDKFLDNITFRYCSTVLFRNAVTQIGNEFHKAQKTALLYLANLAPIALSRALNADFPAFQSVNNHRLQRYYVTSSGIVIGLLFFAQCY